MEPKTLFDYFKSIAERQGRYHDHKENTAWACLVLHLALCGALLHFDDKCAGTGCLDTGLHDQAACLRA